MHKFRLATVFVLFASLAITSNLLPTSVEHVRHGEVTRLSSVGSYGKPIVCSLATMSFSPFVSISSRNNLTVFITRNKHKSYKIVVCAHEFALKAAREGLSQAFALISNSIMLQ